MTFAVLSWVFVLLNIAALAMLARKGWVIRAGLTMLFASMLPIAVMLASEEELTPGSGMVVLVCAPFALIALLTIAYGLYRWLIRIGFSAQGHL